MLAKKEKQLEEFLNNVDDQIAYQPMHFAVNEELRAHIDDKAEMYMGLGLDEDTSYDKAIRDMGDAYVLGTQFNETHRLRNAKTMLILLIVLVILGLIRNIAADGIVGVWESFYYVIGLGVLGVVFFRGYPALLQYGEKIFKILFATMIFLLSR